MPEDSDEREPLGGAPTAVTAVVADTRHHGETEQLPIPKDADPAWADAALSPQAPTLDATPSQEGPPKPAAGQGVRALMHGVAHEFTRLSSGARLILIVVSSALAGLLLGLIVAPRGAGPQRADDDLVQLARRMSIEERDAVIRALSVSDTTAALMMLRAMGTKDHVAGDPLALALRGRLGLVTKDGSDALDSFEAALTAGPKVADEPWLAAAVVQTFAANKPARTNALLAKLPKAEALEALERACMDWQVRVRRSAEGALKPLNGACPDPVGVMMVDAYQAEKCDAARAVVQKLVPLERTDERVGAALDALSRRPPVAGCVADLIPRK